MLETELLRIKSSVEPTQFTPICEVDEDVPIRYRAEKSLVPGLVYWRIGDFKKSLIEVGVHGETGLLHKVTITSVLPSQITYQSFATEPCDRGLPVCDLSILNGKDRLDISGDFRIRVSDSNLRVEFADASDSAVYCCWGNASFLRDRSEKLVAILFKDIDVRRALTRARLI